MREREKRINTTTFTKATPQLTIGSPLPTPKGPLCKPTNKPGNVHTSTKLATAAIYLSCAVSRVAYGPVLPLWPLILRPIEMRARRTSGKYATVEAAL